MKYKTHAPDPGFILQPRALIVPGRRAWVPESGIDSQWMLPVQAFEVEEWHPGDRVTTYLRKRNTAPGHPEWSGGESGMMIREVSIQRWDLAGFSASELDSLQVAIDRQRAAGVGNPAPSVDPVRVE